MLFCSNCEIVRIRNYTQELRKPRSNHRMCSVRKGGLKNFAKFLRKHLWQSRFFNKIATLLENSFRRRCFPVNCGKFLRTPFLQNTSGQLLLKTSLSNFEGGELTKKKQKPYLLTWKKTRKWTLRNKTIALYIPIDQLLSLNNSF